MAAPRRKFQRPPGKRRYKKLFLIATEGGKTEPDYFRILDNINFIVRVSCLKGRHKSAPPYVLKRMAEYIKSEELRPSDEAWLVVDKDSWTNEQLKQLHQWSLQQDNYGFALSNPKFEYWLLLHFEDGAEIHSSRDCTTRLRCWIPDYDKGVDARKISPSQIHDAIDRAKKRDNPPCTDWPKNPGQTTVYHLVENILSTT